MHGVIRRTQPKGQLGIEDKIPDHSVFCRARHERFRESDALRRVFEGVVAMCIAAGLVGGEAFSVDASLIKAALDAARSDEGRSGDGDGGSSSTPGAPRDTALRRAAGSHEW